MNLGRGGKLAYLFQNVGASLGNIFVVRSFEDSYKLYNPLSCEEQLKQDRESLRKDWEAVGDTLGNTLEIIKIRKGKM